MSYSVVDNTPCLLKNKTMLTLFIVSNYGCLYKSDLFKKLNDIDPDISIYYLNRIIENLISKRLIGTLASTYSSRRKIYYICGRGWSKIEKYLKDNSELYIKYKKLEKTTRPRTAPTYREEQAAIASISNVMPCDYLPIELPAIPNRDRLDSNASGCLVHFSKKEELSEKTFFLPWYQMKSDNFVSIRNNALTTYWYIQNEMAMCAAFFMLKTNPQKNILTVQAYNQLKERYLAICQQYSLTPTRLNTVITFDIVNSKNYIDAIKDVFLGEHQNDFFWQRDRYGDSFECRRSYKSLRHSNQNVDYIIPFSSASNEDNPGIYLLEKNDCSLCGAEFKSLIRASIG